MQPVHPNAANERRDRGGANGRHDTISTNVKAVELREIAFGLFDGIADEYLPKLFPREYEHYDKHKRFEGEFFAPMPLGESRVHVADRVKGVFGTILRDADPERSNPIEMFIVVRHGVTIRCFRMQWMHHPWEWYEREVNPHNCSVQLIEGRAGSWLHRTRGL